MDFDITNVDDLLSTFDETWAPRVVATMNEWALKVARVAGDYVWHAHTDTDEVFLVKEGTLEIALRTDEGERQVRLGPNDTFVVPRGVEHRPSSPDGAIVYLVEPAATLSTGDYAGEVPEHITSTTGLPG